MSEQRRSEAEPDPRILAELSALADGSLAPERADEVLERIEASPGLAERYERERRAVGALRELRSDRAPASLRFAIEEHRLRAPARRERVRYGGILGLATAGRAGRILYGGTLAAATAVAVALLILLLPGGSPGAPSVSQAAALALTGPTGKAPAVDPRRHSLLRLDVQETYFPHWSGWFGWQAVGQRVDRLDGKLAVTVYYRFKRDGREIAYTILASPPLRRPDARAAQVDGISLQSFTMHGRLVVTWRRAGHTCILSGARTSTAELAKLAGWKADGLAG
jgi:hypothetical protein